VHIVDERLAEDRVGPSHGLAIAGRRRLDDLAKHIDSVAAGKSIQLGTSKEIRKKLDLSPGLREPQKFLSTPVEIVDTLPERSDASDRHGGCS
jgi:hypothetical protein